MPAIISWGDYQLPCNGRPEEISRLQCMLEFPLDQIYRHSIEAPHIPTTFLLGRDLCRIDANTFTRQTRLKQKVVTHSVRLHLSELRRSLRAV